MRIEARSGIGWLQRARFPLLVVALGGTLTLVMAIAAQQSAEREQLSEFENAVQREQGAFIDGVEAYTDEFADAASFMSATFPGTVEEYERFFADSTFTTGDNNFDPGVMLIEEVDAEDLDLLRERERRAGHDDFNVITFDSSRESHYIITRTARRTTLGPYSLLGLDMASPVSDEIARSIDSDMQRIFAIPRDDEVLALFQADGLNRDGNEFVLLVSEIEDPRTNSRAGWGAHIFDPLELAQEVGGEAADSLNVAVEVLGRRGQVVDVDTGSGVEFTDAALTRDLAFETHGLEWRLQLWADKNFGTATGLFDQSLIWTFGVLVTGALAILAIWRAVHEHNLSRATFELEHARTLATTDPLTGLLNRQGFMELAAQVDLTDGGTLFFVDLDGFKTINDSQGHAAGDQVLRDVAHRLNEQFRGIDLVSRYGGDEFVVFTPGLFGAETELQISQRVIAAVAGVEQGLTCSLGTTARVPYDETTIETLIDRADEAMYRAKESGGGRFEVGVA